MYDVTLDINKCDATKGMVLIKARCESFRIIPYLTDSAGASSENSIKIILELFDVNYLRYEKDHEEV